MKKVILVILLIFTLSLTISAEINPVLRFVFESAIETDRRQSYQWHFATQEKPIVLFREDKVIDGELYTVEKVIFEWNPFIAGQAEKNLIWQ